jgi:hypothetical protein
MTGITFCVLPTIGDGSCFFHSIACALLPALAELYDDWLAKSMRTKFYNFLKIKAIDQIVLSGEISKLLDICSLNEQRKLLIDSIKVNFAYMSLDLVEAFCQFIRKNILIVLHTNSLETPFKSFVVNPNWNYIILQWDNCMQHVSIFYRKCEDQNVFQFSKDGLEAIQMQYYFVLTRTINYR